MPLSEPIRRRLILALADQEDGQEFIDYLDVLESDLQAALGGGAGGDDVEVALIEAEAGFWR